MPRDWWTRFPSALKDGASALGPRGSFIPVDPSSPTHRSAARTAAASVPASTSLQLTNPSGGHKLPGPPRHCKSATSGRIFWPTSKRTARSGSAGSSKHRWRDEVLRFRRTGDRLQRWQVARCPGCSGFLSLRPGQGRPLVCKRAATQTFSRCLPKAVMRCGFLT